MADSHHSITKKASQARSMGQDRYYNGKVCENGHDSYRYANNYKCVACVFWRQTKSASLAGMLCNARSRAKIYEREFSLEEADMILPKHCKICGVKMKFHVGKAQRDSFSLDRIDNDRGYVKDNVCIICLQCNMFKKDHNIEEIERLLKYMKREI